jgi:signal peptidase I
VSKRRRVVLIVAAGLAGLLVVAWLAVGLLFDGYKIPSEAMSPRLGVDDRVLARSIDGEDVSRGDVIIYRAPEQSGPQSFERISRVVAIAGDEIGEDDGLLTINGTLADESWVPDGQTTFGIEPQEVPDGHVFVMGDNRGDAQDSRFFGPLPYDNVLKLVVVRWWPLGKFGGL